MVKALNGSRLQVKAIIEHISHVHIIPTLHTLLLYSMRCCCIAPAGGRCILIHHETWYRYYICKIRDIVAARNYSWACCPAFLYRELCNASEKGKAAIGGALQLVQIWAWSRIIPLCPGLGDFNPQLWRSICPLIFYAIVDMHHPERVLRQFGMMQNIPDQPDTRDMSLHKITRSNRTGTDWILQHILYITRCQRRNDTVIQRQPISNRRDTDRGYWEWYNNITRHFVSSSTDRRVESGYQLGDAPMLQIVPQQTATPSDSAPTTSHKQRRSSSQMSIGSVERGDIGVDIVGPSTAYTPQDYYVPQPPQDHYVPQPSQDDWFQSTSYMPSHAEAYSSHVDLDLGLGINQPYAPEYSISPVPFPSFSAYRDNVESSSAASSSGCILIPVGKDEAMGVWYILEYTEEDMR
ncbi:protein MAIN-LIKE 1 [Sesamum angolense]|uniref:Protein MAIN-LIKE 1 n=1 Tax=Sesamum angolense TaxID=2727404 RepID=A0AAE1T8A9_9LAMI|nr:protein MAIN-LIKE 1 [Sesamum angolense]